jgi:hypothetical protein
VKSISQSVVHTGSTNCTKRVAEIEELGWSWRGCSLSCEANSDMIWTNVSATATFHTGSSLQQLLAGRRDKIKDPWVTKSCLLRWKKSPLSWRRLMSQTTLMSSRSLSKLVSQGQNSHSRWQNGLSCTCILSTLTSQPSKQRYVSNDGLRTPNLTQISPDRGIKKGPDYRRYLDSKLQTNNSPEEKTQKTIRHFLKDWI